MKKTNEPNESPPTPKKSWLAWLIITVFGLVKWAVRIARLLDKLLSNGDHEWLDL